MGAMEKSLSPREGVRMACLLPHLRPVKNVEEAALTGIGTSAAVKVSHGPPALQSASPRERVRMIATDGPGHKSVYPRLLTPRRFSSRLRRLTAAGYVVFEHCVIVELKSIETIARVHKKILLTYLRLADKRLGLLINFGVELIKDGITRVVNGLEN